jgi:uncharacterized protein
MPCVMWGRLAACGGLSTRLQTHAQSPPMAAGIRARPGASAPWRIVYTNCYDRTVVISGFEWDDDNALHIERHGFTPEEVAEVFAGDHKIRRARQRRYIALGETLDGRLAFVVFRRLPGGLVRVITARDMEADERRLFRRK